MGTRALLFIAASLALGSADASERFSLRYPGWTLYLDLRQPRFAQDPLAAGEGPVGRSFGIRLPGKGLLSESGLRLPLSDSAFVNLEATFTAPHVNPALAGTARPVFQAGVGLGLEF